MNRFLELLASMGQSVMSIFESIGRGTFFMMSLIPALPYSFMRLDLLVKQIYFAGVLSLPIILTAGLFVGMVMSLQGYNVLVDFFFLGVFPSRGFDITPFSVSKLGSCLYSS